MKWSAKPVVVVGGGAYGYDLSKVYDLNVPILTSWQAADLIDNFHPNWFGRPGIYGQRTANKVLWEADQVVTLGCRLSKWLIGHGGLNPQTQIVMCDVDENEVQKFPKAVMVTDPLDEFLESLWTVTDSTWINQCHAWRVPFVEDCHKDTTHINAYRFMEALEPYLRPKEIVAVDVGNFACPAFQVLRFRPPQRVITSGGLGEMGCGLPAAIGASFATDKGPVLALIGDGGMAMNLQELQTILTHKLPISILVFANDGYSMIRGSYQTVNLSRAGVDKASGLEMPDYRRIAHGWGMAAADIRNWDDFHQVIPQMFSSKEPCLVQVHLDPEQTYLPRLLPLRKEDGTFIPARLDQMSPIDARI